MSIFLCTKKIQELLQKQGYHKTSDSNFNFLDSMSNADIHLYIEKNLSKGEYYIFCDNN